MHLITTESLRAGSATTMAPTHQYCSISTHLHDLVELDVGPVDGLALHVGRDGDDILGVDREPVGEAEEVELGRENAEPVRDEDVALRVVQRLARPLVPVDLVARVARARVRALGVLANLTI